MTVARRIARILGPVLVVLAPTEALNLSAFAGIAAPIVYLNGTLLLAAGVAILQVHARWALNWTSLITLLGWAMTIAGIYRMAFPAGPQAAATIPTYALLGLLFTVGGTLSWKGYRSPRDLAAS